MIHSKHMKTVYTFMLRLFSSRWFLLPWIIHRSQRWANGQVSQWPREQMPLILSTCTMYMDCVCVVRKCIETIWSKSGEKKHSGGKITRIFNCCLLFFAPEIVVNFRLQTPQCSSPPKKKTSIKTYFDWVTDDFVANIPNE